MRQPLRSLFEETTISPSMTLDGKIIVLDLPVHEYGVAGSRAHPALSLSFPTYDGKQKSRSKERSGAVGDSGKTGRKYQ